MKIIAVDPETNQEALDKFCNMARKMSDLTLCSDEDVMNIFVYATRLHLSLEE